MNSDSPIPDLTQFRVPAVRHLAWMCRAPQLFSSPLKFDLSSHLPSDTLETLQRWDEKPEEGPSFLTATPHPRLGLYFEGLYECLMTEILGWDLLAKNLQIKSPERTLGELDFVLRNPQTELIEHHEIAVKFYLGYESPESGFALWYGPNVSDRLDIKIQRMLEHQSQRTQLAETGEALALLDIRGPLRSRVFMPGYLFYPFEPSGSESGLQSGLQSGLASPSQAPADHARGYWLYLGAAEEMNTQCWVHLRKPYWLGPWVQAGPPESANTEATLASVHSTGTPRLFASLQHDEQTGLWKEKERVFVVPEQWPGC